MWVKQHRYATHRGRTFCDQVVLGTAIPYILLTRGRETILLPKFGVDAQVPTGALTVLFKPVSNEYRATGINDDAQKGAGTCIGIVVGLVCS